MWSGLSAFIGGLSLTSGWIKPVLFMLSLLGVVVFCQWQRNTILTLEQRRTELTLALEQADSVIMSRETQLQEQRQANEQAMALLDKRYQAQLAIYQQRRQKQAELQDIYQAHPVAKAWADELMPVDVIRLLKPSDSHQISD